MAGWLTDGCEIGHQQDRSGQKHRLVASAFTWQTISVVSKTNTQTNKTNKIAAGLTYGHQLDRPDPQLKAG